MVRVFTLVVSSLLEWTGIACFMVCSRTKSFAAFVVSSNPVCKPISTRIVSPNEDTTASEMGPITGAAIAPTPPYGNFFEKSVAKPLCIPILTNVAYCSNNDGMDS